MTEGKEHFTKAHEFLNKASDLESAHGKHIADVSLLHLSTEELRNDTLVNKVYLTAWNGEVALNSVKRQEVFSKWQRLESLNSS